MERENGNYRFIAEKLKEADNTSEKTIDYWVKIKRWEMTSCSRILTPISKATEKGAVKSETKYDKSLEESFSHMATWERNIYNTHI